MMHARFIASALLMLAAIATRTAELRAGMPDDGPKTVPMSTAPELDAGFHLLYELKFPEARGQFASWEKKHPEDPIGSVSYAAGYLFEEFYYQGELPSRLRELK